MEEKYLKVKNNELFIGDFSISEIAKKFGHKVVKPTSALCPILVKEDISTLNGLTLRNVSLTITENDKSLSEFGDLLFTFNSLTGPIALTLSSLINKWDLKTAKAYIDNYLRK